MISAVLFLFQKVGFKPLQRLMEGSHVRLIGILIAIGVDLVESERETSGCECATNAQTNAGI